MRSYSSGGHPTWSCHRHLFRPQHLPRFIGQRPSHQSGDYPLSQWSDINFVLYIIQNCNSMSLGDILLQNSTILFLKTGSLLTTTGSPFFSSLLDKLTLSPQIGSLQVEGTLVVSAGSQITSGGCLNFSQTTLFLNGITSFSFTAATGCYTSFKSVVALSKPITNWSGTLPPGEVGCVVEDRSASLP